MPTFNKPNQTAQRAQFTQNPVSRGIWTILLQQVVEFGKLFRRKLLTPTYYLQ